MKKIILCALLLVSVVNISWAEDYDEREEHSLAHKLLLYIPNRVLDVFDLVRAKLRVGPGLAVSVRATKPVCFFFGSYGTVYAGLPGPRQRPTIPLPIGLESYNGLEASVVDLASGMAVGPNYSSTEIGVGFQLLVIGADVDVDPMEFVDFLGGFILLDPRHDDF